MRRHLWSAAVLASLAVIAGGQVVLAQYDDDFDGSTGRIQLTAEAQPRPFVPYDADWPAGQPGPTGNPYQSYRQFGPDPRMYPPPAYNSPVGTANLVPAGRPWPEISPYEHQYSRYDKSDGLWFQEFRDILGSDREYYVGFAYLDSRFRRPNARTVGSKDPRIPAANPANPGVFQPVKLSSKFPDGGESEGFLVRWGYNHADESGFELQTFIYTETTSKYSRGTGYGNILEPEWLRDTNGIPWADGTANIGSTATYDIQFLLTHSSEAYGATVDFFRTPWMKSNWYRVRPTMGGRVMTVQEKFTFLGKDSNLNYLILPGGRPVPGTVVPNPNGLPAYEAYFQSRAESYLFGPEAGLQYEMGGKAFKLGGSTKFSLMGNWERLNFEGRNLGDGFVIDFRTANSAFSQRQYNAHVSPGIEQTLFLECPIFEYIPYLNKMHYFTDARFRIGYNYLYIGQISRPEDNIVYRGFPQKPELNPSHSKWDVQNVSFEIDWKY